MRVLQVIGVMDRGGAETMVMNLYRAMDRERIQFDFLVHERAKVITMPKSSGSAGVFSACRASRG